MRGSISPNESVAIIESQGMMAAARLVQVIGQESRARIVVVAPVTTTGSVTTIVAGPLAEVQHALDVAREHNVVSDSAFFARPNLTTMEMLVGSALGEPVKVPRVQGKRKLERSLPLFTEAPSQKPRSSAVKKQSQKIETAAKKAKAHGPSRKRAVSVAPFSRRALADVERMSVHTLRRYSRTIPEFPILGREISIANRSELMQLIKSHFEFLDARSARATASGVSTQTLMPN